MAWFPKLAEIAPSLRRLLRSAWRGELTLPVFLSRLTGIAGFAATLGSAFAFWFSIPAAVSPAAPFVSEVPFVSWAYRAASFGVSLATLVIFIRSSSWRARLTRLYLAWAVALLFFPYFVSVWSPEVAGRASWLQSQHRSLTNVTGDIYMSQEYKGSLLRHRVDVVNRPLDTQVFLLPDWDPPSFGWSRILEMVEWFGLTDWFASFLRKGWPLALGGSVAILLALVREAGPAALRELQKLLLHSGALFLAASILALAPVLIAGSCLSTARRCTQEGDYASAHRWMRRAALGVPVITQDGQYLMQAGLLANALGVQDSEAAYYRARFAEDAGFHFQAQTIYLEGLSAHRQQPALLREEVKGLLRLAANAMNTGELDSATLLLEKVLAADPANLKANYSLQLAYLRIGDIGGLRELQLRMTDVYAYFNTPLKTAVLANAGENRAAGELLRGDVAAALQAWRDAKNP